MTGESFPLYENQHNPPSNWPTKLLLYTLTWDILSCKFNNRELWICLGLLSRMHTLQHRPWLPMMTDHLTTRSAASCITRARGGARVTIYCLITCCSAQNKEALSWCLALLWERFFLHTVQDTVARKEKYQRIKSELADYFLTLLPTPRVHILEMHSISSVHSPSQALPTMVFVTLLQSKTFKCYSSTDREMLKSHLSLITAPWIWSNIISMRSAVLEVGSPPESEIWSCVPTKKSKKSYTFCPCQQG